MNERTLSLFKQQINDIESEYNNKIKVYLNFHYN